MVAGGPRLVLISLEPWDSTWRRNQYLCRELLASGAASEIDFVAPARPLASQRSWPLPGVTVLEPRRRVPNRLGGTRLVASGLSALVRAADVLWVNDPYLGALASTYASRVVYDVTDDWRYYPFPDRVRRRIAQAEGRLADTALTVVCSDVLRQRWAERYGVTAEVVPHGVDVDRYARAVPVTLDDEHPRIGYVGTLQPERLDIDLVTATARSLDGRGTVHLLGPDALGDVARAALLAEPNIVLHGPRPAEEVPAFMSAMDVLVCPHLVDGFTMSLDAIKAYEYAAVGRPVVATPTSGFQDLRHVVGITVTEPGAFVEGVRVAAGEGAARPAPLASSDWSSRAAQFAACLSRALS